MKLRKEKKIEGHLKNYWKIYLTLAVVALALGLGLGLGLQSTDTIDGTFIYITPNLLPNNPEDLPIKNPHRSFEYQQYDIKCIKPSVPMEAPTYEIKIHFRYRKPGNPSDGLFFGDRSDNGEGIIIKQFGGIPLVRESGKGNLDGRQFSNFYGKIQATDTPTLLEGTDLAECFNYDSDKIPSSDNPERYTGVENWDTKEVTRMESMFFNASDFNKDISGWNTSKVNAMGFMFTRATSFNQDIGGWDVSNVIDMNGMFDRASSFNKDISGWNTAKVTNMENMFFLDTVTSSSFSQDLSKWCVSKIKAKPNLFINPAVSMPSTFRQPPWGQCPRGENSS